MEGLTLLDGKAMAIEAGDTSDVLYGVAFDIETTTVVGMLVDLNEQRIVSICSKKSVGNAAGTGAVQALLFSDNLQRCITIANKVNYVELAAQPGFQNRFLSNRKFPNSDS